jgi:hypothetical protein
MADESGLSRNRRYIVRDTEKASLNKLQTNKHRLSKATEKLGKYFKPGTSTKKSELVSLLSPAHYNWN